MTARAAPLLEIRDLAIHRGQWHIQLPELHLAQGELKAITGASGCGKSTLLELIGLVLKPEQLGCYRLGEQDIGQWLQTDDQARLADTRAQQLGFVLQSGGLLPFLSVQQNIQLPRRMLGLSLHSDAVAQAVDCLGLKPLLHQQPAQLSIGERQRVAFVRAIAHEPALLLADEPTAALDPPQARRLLELMIELVQGLNMAALLVSHDWALVQDCGLSRLAAQTTAGGSCFVPC